MGGKAAPSQFSPRRLGVLVGVADFFFERGILKSWLWTE